MRTFVLGFFALLIGCNSGERADPPLLTETIAMMDDVCAMERDSDVRTLCNGAMRQYFVDGMYVGECSDPTILCSDELATSWGAVPPCQRLLIEAAYEECSAQYRTYFECQTAPGDFETCNWEALCGAEYDSLLECVRLAMST